MNKKNNSADSNSEAVKKINKAYGLSYNDAKALLAQASEVPTTDEIALEPLYEDKKSESSPTKLNQVDDQVNLSRNGPTHSKD